MAISESRDWRTEDPANRIEMTTTRTETAASGRPEAEPRSFASSAGTAGRPVAGGSSALEALGGLAAVVLAIIALASTSTSTAMFLGAIIAIVIGAALFMQATSRTAQFVRGISSGFAGGAAGIVLGILAIVGLVPMTLLAVAAIVFGAVTLMAGAGMGWMNAWRSADDWSVEHCAIAATAGTLVLGGLAALVLGIVAIVGTTPLTLTLIAYLCLGCSVLMCGSAMTGRAWHGFRS